ncbi:MAG: dockerin type I domain-containing protein, partial [Halobacteriota archaeon]
FPITVYIAGDANGDGEVNVLDVVWVGKNWRRECPATNPCANNCTAYLWDDEQEVDSADLNNDCEINVLDVVIIGANWRHVAG